MNDSNLFNSSDHTVAPNTQDNTVNNNMTTDASTLDTTATPDSNNPTLQEESQVTDNNTQENIGNNGLDPEKDLGINSSTNNTQENIGNNGLDPEKDLGINSSTNNTQENIGNNGLDPEKDLGINNNQGNMEESNNPNPLDTSNISFSTNTIDSNSYSTTENSIQTSVSDSTSNTFVDNNVSSTTNTETIKTHWNWAGFMFNWLYIAIFNGKSGLFYFLMTFIVLMTGEIVVNILKLILISTSYSYIITIIITIISTIIIPVYLGLKGESIVWKKGKFEDQKEFYTAQKYLSKLGLVFFEIIFTIMIIFFIVIILFINLLHL